MIHPRNQLFIFILTLHLTTDWSTGQADVGEAKRTFYPGLQQTWIGVTRKGSPIEAGICEDDLNYTTKKVRILIVGGLDGSADSSQFAIDANSRFQALGRGTRAHERFALSIVVDSNPDASDNSPANKSGGDPSRGYPPKSGFYNSPTDPEAAYLWRWIGIHAPDLVVIAYRGDKPGWRIPKSDDRQLKKLGEQFAMERVLPVNDAPSDSLEQGLVNSAPSKTGVIPAIGITVSGHDRQCMDKLIAMLDGLEFTGPSPARRAIQKRLDRTPLQVAQQLSEFYGHDLKRVVYIPTVALIGRLRLGELTGDKQHLADVRRIVEPYMANERPTNPKSGSSLSGHLIFTELAKLSQDDVRTRLIDLAKNAADLAFDDDGKPQPSMPFHSQMSDAVFMGGPILASIGKLTGEQKYFDACLRHVEFMRKMLLTPDGIYQHSPLDKAPWGRGNGFPALGLALILTDFPDNHPGRKELMNAYQSHLHALLKYQDAGGCWHQVIDKPWSYRELSSTCMITFAILRGLRNGWLDDATFRPVVDRAWYAIRARVAPSGELVDVCTGTGKQKNLRAYYDRTAILGKDPRGGAMAMLVATEMAAWKNHRAANSE